MSKAYVDTTILVDALLKPGRDSKSARAAIRRYEVSEMPVFAIKEFKAGALYAYKWLHNKMQLLNSFSQTLFALQKMSLTPRKYTIATAIQGLAQAAKTIGSRTNAQLETKYGRSATIDSCLCDEYRLYLKYLIFRAWQQRRELTSVVLPLSCYNEVKPIEINGEIRLDHLQCDKKSECSLAAKLRARTDDLKALKKANDVLPPNRERTKRSQALRSLMLGRMVDEQLCRSLGDAIFAFFAPSGSAILTTNAKDMEPLAKALGKSIDLP
jgi:hypothetical protein